MRNKLLESFSDIEKVSRQVDEGMAKREAELSRNYGGDEMTNVEILKKAIDKAVKNGFPKNDCDVVDIYRPHLISWIGIHYLIFNHDFAKAFWGEKKNVCTVCGSKEIVGCGTEYSPYYCRGCRKEISHKSILDKGCWRMEGMIVHEGWEYHLQQMVLKSEPLKYLEKFLK